MEEIEYYTSYIQRAAETNILEMLDIVIFLQQQLVDDPKQMSKMVEIGKELLTGVDHQNNSLHNLFPEESKEISAVLTAIAFEIKKANVLHAHHLSFEEYDISQPVFQEYPELMEKLRVKPNGNFDYELIKWGAIKYKPIPYLPKYRSIKYKESYLSVDKHLNTMIPFYLIDKYKKEEDLYIRIDPYFISKEEPEMILEEEAIHKPNPHWIEKMNLYPGQHEGSEFFLPDYSVEDIRGNKFKIKQFWEYSIKGIRKLQTNAQMKNESSSNHFSMSLEELSEENIKDGILIGRMIHLDALDSFDTPFDEVRLKHLDLAINIYKDQAIEERMNSTLASGNKVTKATYRTHLIRADNIMFSDLLEIVVLFFRSETMVEEWIKEQFIFKS